MKNFHPFILLFLLFSVVYTPVCGQRETWIGPGYTIESADAGLHEGIGILMEQKLTKHSGIEGGIFYKNYRQGGTVTVITATQIYSATLRVVEHYVSIPLLYKFYTHIVNVSAGPAFDYYVGFTQKNKSSSFTINSYSVSPVLSVGLLFKVSRSFPLNKQLLLEPELRLNPNFSYERTLAGLGIAVKYMLQ